MSEDPDATRLNPAAQPRPQSQRPAQRRPAPRQRRRRRGPQKSNTGIILGGVIAGGLVIVLVIGLIVIATRSAPGETPVAAATPEQVVTKFFDALVAGDAEAAVALQAGQVPASELLTDEVLQYSARVAPITDVVARQTGPAEVLVTYRMGEQPAQATFAVVQNEDEDWQLASVTTNLEVKRPTNLPVLVNDVAITTDTVAVLPGVYQLSTSLPRIVYDTEPFLVEGPSSFPVVEPKPQLSDAGVEAFRAATEQALEACMERRELQPSDCPQHVELRENQEVDPATIVWEVTNDPLSSFNPTLAEEDPTRATVDLDLEVRITVNVRVDDSEGEVESTYEWTTSASGSVTSDPIRVTFTTD